MTKVVKNLTSILLLTKIDPPQTLLNKERPILWVCRRVILKDSLE